MGITLRRIMPQKNYYIIIIIFMYSRESKTIIVNKKTGRRMVKATLERS